MVGVVVGMRKGLVEDLRAGMGRMELDRGLGVIVGMVEMMKKTRVKRKGRRGRRKRRRRRKKRR